MSNLIKTQDISMSSLHSLAKFLFSPVAAVFILVLLIAAHSIIHFLIKLDFI